MVLDTPHCLVGRGMTLLTLADKYCSRGSNRQRRLYTTVKLAKLESCESVEFAAFRSGWVWSTLSTCSPGWLCGAFSSGLTRPSGSWNATRHEACPRVTNDSTLLMRTLHPKLGNFTSSHDHSAV